MSILDNARYAEIGKKAEAKTIADKTVAAVAPQIEKEAIRRAAPVIQEQTARHLFDSLLAAKQNETYNPYGDGLGLSQLQIR